MSSALHYTFPTPQHDINGKLSSSETQHERSDSGSVSKRPEPSITTEPYIKRFDTSSSNSPDGLVVSLDDPIDDILVESQTQIDEFVIKLPSTVDDTQMYSQVSPVKKLSPLPKPHRSVLENLDQNTRPTPNPIFAAKTYGCSETEAEICNHVPNTQPHRDLQTEQPRSKHDFKCIEVQPRTSIGRLSEQSDDSTADTTGDPLACHAENIMRMAMDTTTHASFCNHSISSNFSNIVDDSFVGKNAGEGSKKAATNSLNFQRATKVEISAEDLVNAVNDPFRLT